jgi:putative ABC transport system permease protein
VNGETYTVSGVFEGFRFQRPDIEPSPQAILYRYSVASSVVLRVDGTGDEVLPAIRLAFQQIWPDHVARRIIRMSDERKQLNWEYQATSILLSTVSLVSVLLAITGMMGALSHILQQRRREFAIRLALGASHLSVKRSILGIALMCVGLGLGFGVVGGSLVARVFSASFSGVGTVDPITIVAVSLGMLALGWIAAQGPARTAARVDPASLLREL